jgi:hypothetical protein
MIRLSYLCKFTLPLTSRDPLPCIYLFIYLFIHGLFNDAVSSSDYEAPNDRMIRLMNNKLLRLFREAFVATFKVIYRHICRD